MGFWRRLGWYGSAVVVLLSVVAVGELDPPWATGLVDEVPVGYGGTADVVAGAGGLVYGAGSGVSGGLVRVGVGGSGLVVAAEQECLEGLCSVVSAQSCRAGEVYMSKYKGCVPEHCEHGRDGNGQCLSCPPS